MRNTIHAFDLNSNLARHSHILNQSVRMNRGKRKREFLQSGLPDEIPARTKARLKKLSYWKLNVSGNRFV